MRNAWVESKEMHKDFHNKIYKDLLNKIPIFILKLSKKISDS